LTDRDMNPSRERLELIGGQVAEISLYGPQFFKHDARDSVKRSEIKTSVDRRERECYSKTHPMSRRGMAGSGSI
jgi:hypothetical protein